MDSFTENLLSRARERQKLLENYSNDENEARVQEKKSSKVQEKSNFKLQNKLTCEGNSYFKKTVQDSVTHISSDFSTHKTLNIQNDNFNMEIKVSSVDDVRVEVQIEEDGGEKNVPESDSGLRKDAKNKLNRLGKLYAGGEDANMSSPIHKQTETFSVEDVQRKAEVKDQRMKRGLSKLADLAENFNNFEDDLNSVRKVREEKAMTPKKSSKKLRAPQPPEPRSSPLKHLTNPETKDSSETETDKKFDWDKKVLDSLESQGFTRTESSSRLIYKYENANGKENINKKNTENNEQVKPQLNSPQKPAARAALIADKAALFESPSNRNQKDPALLSVSERKALFEKNKGTPLIPKAPLAMATPSVHTESVKDSPLKKVAPQIPVSKQTVAPEGSGIASKVAALFEQKNTISQQQIEKNVQEQRKQEMDLLLNRFNRPIEVITEEPEHSVVNESTPMIEEKPKVVLTTEKERRSSGNKRCSKSDSPKVAAVLSDVKRIKVSPHKAGRLYPSLTDIESVTETENDETRPSTPNDNSSVENSLIESDDANTSFGRDILRAVCKNQNSQRNQILEDSTSDLSDVLDDMDDYIDEALAYNEKQADGPTPPKQGRRSPVEPSHSFNYKSFQSDNTSEFKSPMKKTPLLADNSDELPTHVVDGDNILPLTHTVSFYRKQQSQTNTPVKQISRQPIIEYSAENPVENQELIKNKLIYLKNEVIKQELIISQTSQALNLCNSTLEFMGSTEQVEAERVLLVATHRRQAIMHERQRLEVEQTLRPQRKHDQFVQKGTLTISKITLPLKQKYVTALAAAGGKGHHVVCLVKYEDQVLPTPLVSTVASSSKNLELELNIPGSIVLRNLYSDFAVTVEVYCLQAQEESLPHEIKYHIKKPNTKMTPKKGKQDSRLVCPLKESPAGPQVVRSPTFALMGYVVFSLSTINKKQWSLNNTPSMSPLEGTLGMSISCEMDVTVEHRGFLTMFEDVSGFGAWHRRWCLLKGDTLSYWKYPDDEKKTPPINSINLRDSITKQVGPVSRDICARLHTFLIEIERDAAPHDKESLVVVRKGAKTIIRHLLSADTKEERLEWCGEFNSALYAINSCSKKH